MDGARSRTEVGGVQDQHDLALERTLELEALPASAPSARAALRALAEQAPQLDAPLRERLPDAELALSELVTNAVLHGREPLTVLLRLEPARLRVEVRDGNPVSPSFGMLDPTAVTGRGLLIVSAAADAWGVEPAPGGKAVWFEVNSSGTGRQAEVDVDELLAAWGDDLAQDPADEEVRVVLTGLDVRLVARSEAHVEGLLRELTLVETSGEAAPAHLRVARQACIAAAAVHGLRGDLKRHLAAAVAAGARTVDVELHLTRTDAEAVRDFARAVDAADLLSRSGALLAEPAPRELSYARQAYLRRVLAQLAS